MLQEWKNQQGVMKIRPTNLVQKFTYSAVPHIQKGIREPVTQVVPVSNVSVQPHQVSFSFFDTTEGRFGVSNAVEKTMVLECDIYVTDLVYYWWNYAKKHDDVNFGYNYFPPKEYKGIKYDEGYYESLVVTLCEGKGDNWWCVLFPPICALEEDSENYEKIEYSFYIKEMFNKYLK